MNLPMMSKLSFLLLVVFSGAGWAAPPTCGCNTFDECKKLLDLVDAKFEIFDVITPRLGTGVFSDGHVRTMVQSAEYMKTTGEPLPKGKDGAVEYCRDSRYVPQPAHLATTAELKVADSQGKLNVEFYYWSADLVDSTQAETLLPGEKHTWPSLRDHDWYAVYCIKD